MHKRKGLKKRKRGLQSLRTKIVRTGVGTKEERERERESGGLGGRRKAAEQEAFAQT